MELKVCFAKLTDSMEKTLQILSILIWFSVMSLLPFLGIFLTIYLLFFSKYWFLAGLYVLWVYLVDLDTSKKGGRRREWLRNLPCWHYFYNYFPLSLHKTDDLPADRNYIFCVFPHGMLCSSAFGHFAYNKSDYNRAFPNIRVYITTINMHFLVPFSREIMMGLGGVSVSKESIMYLLNDKKESKALSIIVGGASEAYFCRPGPYKILLKNRKGFIKIALHTGTSLVPIFNFGETALYDQVDSVPGSWFRCIQDFLRTNFGFCPIIPKGSCFFGIPFSIIPRKHPVATVVGKPIDVEKIENPTQEQIDKLHETFTNEIVKLFEENKHKYETDPEKMELILV